MPMISLYFIIFIYKMKVIGFSIPMTFILFYMNNFAEKSFFKIVPWHMDILSVSIQILIQFDNSKIQKEIR